MVACNGECAAREMQTHREKCQTARANRLDLARQEFCEEILSSVRLVGDARDIMIREDSYLSESDIQDRIEKVAEVAFLNLVISWEAFIESTFVLYLMGEEAGNGHRPDLLIGKIGDEVTAYKLLSGNLDFNIEKRSLSYLLNPGEIMKVVSFFFDSHSYEVIDIESDLIRYARYIRNHIAHNSKGSRTYFTEVTRDFIGEDQDISVGKFLLSPVKRKVVSPFFDNKNWTHFEAYCAFFIFLAVLIAPEKDK